MKALIEMDSLVSIISEVYRFQNVSCKALSRLAQNEQRKYKSQYAWFQSKFEKFLNEVNIKLITLDGKIYDTGMAVTPINIGEFQADDRLIVAQTIEPIIMKDDTVLKSGTVILGRE